MPARYALARKRAQELLKAGNVSSLPVPVKKLAKLAGAVIKYAPFDGQLSGMVQIRKDEPALIGVNANHVEARQSFTIAHELGHLLLHSNKSFHIDNIIIGRRNEASSMAVDDNEIEANQFAAELLMPRYLLEEVLEGVDLDCPDQISDLAKKIGVSHQALSIRLSRLNFVL